MKTNNIVILPISGILILFLLGLSVPRPVEASIDTSCRTNNEYSEYSLPFNCKKKPMSEYTGDAAQTVVFNYTQTSVQCRISSPAAQQVNVVYYSGCSTPNAQQVQQTRQLAAGTTYTITFSSDCGQDSQHNQAALYFNQGSNSPTRIACEAVQE
jgi:hypothetical protein